VARIRPTARVASAAPATPAARVAPAAPVATTLPLFPDAGPRYLPFREELGFVPYSILDPWGSAEARVRDVELRALIGDHGQSRRGVLGSAARSLMTNEASVFSPVFTEALLSIYGPRPPAAVLDPFAGGGTRAAVCALMGHRYVGIELRRGEVDRVRRALVALGPTVGEAKLLVGDSSDINGVAVQEAAAWGCFDFLLTCPPYWKLERYGGGPDDLSEVSYREYMGGLERVLAWTFESLSPGALAVWVVGNLLDGDEYVDIRADLSVAARGVGWVLHDLPVMRQKIGTAGQRVANSAKSKRLVRIHEYAVVLRRPVSK